MRVTWRTNASIDVRQRCWDSWRPRPFHPAAWIEPVKWNDLTADDVIDKLRNSPKGGLQVWGCCFQRLRWRTRSGRRRWNGVWPIRNCAGPPSRASSKGPRRRVPRPRRRDRRPASDRESTRVRWWTRDAGRPNSPVYKREKQIITLSCMERWHCQHRRLSIINESKSNRFTIAMLLQLRWPRRRNREFCHLRKSRARHVLCNKQ